MFRQRKPTANRHCSKFICFASLESSWKKRVCLCVGKPSTPDAANVNKILAVLKCLCCISLRVTLSDTEKGERTHGRALLMSFLWIELNFKTSAIVTIIVISKPLLSESLVSKPHWGHVVTVCLLMFSWKCERGRADNDGCFLKSFICLPFAHLRGAIIYK